MWDFFTFIADFIGNSIKAIISVFTSIIGGQVQLIRFNDLILPEFMQPILDVILVLMPLFFILNFIRRFL